MQEQQQVGKARVIGYAVGIALVVVVAVWKFVVR
jgi:hypothetical protein